VTAPLFAYEQVTVEVAGSRLLDGVSTEVAASGVTVVVGPSGAGKTTLLRLANRLEVPTQGRVRFRGDDIATLDPLGLRRKVGMVFQHPVLIGATVRADLREVDERLDDAALADALRRVDLPSSFLDRARGELSGGEAQRVSLARVLLTEAEVLLMDEPTASLDPEHRLDIERLVRRLADDGTPVVWVTHDLAQAERLADELLVLVAGRVATPSQLDAFLARPPDPDVPPEGEPR
jgi:putative ABC transport system ATP-binding protein